MDTPTPTPPPAPVTPQPSGHHQYRGFNPWRIFMGLFVVLIGLALLAQQFGWTWIRIEDIWKLWPIFIILVGLSMLSKGHVINLVVSVTLGIVIIAAGILLVINGSTQHATTTKHIAIAAATAATSGTVRLDLGASKVSISGGSDQLIDGTFTSNVTTLSENSSLSNDQQQVTLKMEQPTAWWWGSTKNQLDARLSSTLPVRLDVNSGASDLNLDLSTVKATSVTINSGAASVDLRLGDLVDASTVAISAGASSINISVPTAVGVDVILDAAVSSKTLPGFTELTKNHFQSADYAGTSQKISLTIQAGASSISVNRI